ncbi:putative enzymatic polyprotein [Orchesella cincta]|uniref:Putative enzymatic polyprotein n=1 Tax=Orchesella cincta TaxID=48709 RepID=A0A1D2M2Z1_ORCCI|nr:putative enzymatic polyprotein [Orchesella cincta]
MEGTWSNTHSTQDCIGLLITLHWNSTDAGGSTQTPFFVNGEFLSPIFLVPKPDGSQRFIFNLKSLNQYIENSKFKMEDIRTAIKLMRKGCYMATIDLKDAYYNIPIVESSRKYLRFEWNSNRYEFHCLPFGLCTAPRIFTKIMRPVMSHLRALGLVSVIYIDDVWVMGITYEECTRNVSTTISTLEELGFILNYKKSQLTPAQRVKFLGFYLNSDSMTIELPEMKQKGIHDKCQQFLNKSTSSLQSLSEFIGTLVSVTLAVPYGMLHTKSLEREKFIGLERHNFDYTKSVVLSPDCLKDIHWWSSAVKNAHTFIQSDSFDLTIFTDASTTGWGASCNDLSVGGYWSTHELHLHINCLELIAAYYGLRTFAKTQVHSNILLRIDNVTAIAYINKMGGIRFPHLSNIARTIWDFCESRALHVKATYIPSAENVEADRESRECFKETEWCLSDIHFETIVSQFGHFEVDLFASRINSKCEMYVSWKPDPYCFSVDAFTISWENKNFYAFPPFNMIPRVLKKIIDEHAQGVVVVPKWEAQPWFPVAPSSEQPGFDGRAFAREAFLLMGLSEASLELIVNSLSRQTWKQYQIHFRRWKEFSEDNHQSPYFSDIQIISDFIYHLYNNGASYSTLNSARSALSLILPKIENFPVGSHPIITRMLKGVSRSRPPAPRYESTWDPSCVLSYYNNLGPNENLNLTNLSYKCVTLLALATAQRVQTLSLMSRSNIVVRDDGLEVFIPERIKTSGIKATQPCLVIPKFVESPNLCVMSCLTVYLSVTSKIMDHSHDRVFVSISKPHVPVTTQTLSRWIKGALASCGIDTRLFCAHSTRHAATSAAYRNGVAIDEIKARAGWSERSKTFANFYNRPLDTRQNFAKSVFGMK